MIGVCTPSAPEFDNSPKGMPTGQGNPLDRSPTEFGLYIVSKSLCSQSQCSMRRCHSRLATPSDGYYLYYNYLNQNNDMEMLLIFLFPLETRNEETRPVRRPLLVFGQNFED